MPSLFWNIAYDQFLECLARENLCHCCYVDDTMNIVKADCVGSLQINVMRVMNFVEDMFPTHDLTMNIHKSKTMVADGGNNFRLDS